MSNINADIARNQYEVEILLDYAKAKQRELENYQNRILPARQAELDRTRNIVEEERKNLDKEERKRSEAIQKYVLLSSLIKDFFDGLGRDSLRWYRLKHAEITLKNEKKRMETAQTDSNDWQKQYNVSPPMSIPF